MNLKTCLYFLLISTSAITAHSKSLSVITENRTPYQYYDNEKNLTGYCADAMNKILEKAKIDSDIKVLPWPRAYKLALERPNYLIFSISRSELRENQFLWGGRLVKERIFAWKLKSNTVKISSHEELKSHRFSISRSTNAAQTAKKLDFQKLHLVDDSNQSLKMLYAGQVDFIFATNEAPKRAASLGVDAGMLEKVTELSDFSNDLYFAFSKGTDDKTIVRIMNAYEALSTNGEFAKLKQKWQVD